MSTFTIQATAIEPAALARSLADPACGGFATFEGWVRNHHEGRAVERLEYEAYGPLAISEGEIIVAQACRRFGLRRAACVHRTGSLAIGEIAVWVGASAPHRAAAFDGCRFIIDEVKQRVPIWKKEFYTDGTVAWVNCAACAGPRAARHGA